jgi:hypothetical protein
MAACITAAMTEDRQNLVVGDPDALRRSCLSLAEIVSFSERFEAAERLWADVVLNPFGVDRSGFGRDAERQEELVDRLMSLTRAGGKFGSGAGQLNRLIRFGLNQSDSHQSIQDAADGDVTDCEPGSKIDDATDRPLANDFGDRLDIILSRFAGVIAAGAPVRYRIAGSRCWLGRSFQDDLFPRLSCRRIRAPC